MNTVDVLVVRIYITEASKMLAKIVEYLKNTAQIHGVSVFRAIQGFGETGTHSTDFVDLSLDLPLVIEFFDSKEKITPALEYLASTIKPEHMIFWEAKANAK